ncbi:MFS general substrate transporter [Testicularia cyperi]|uniref:MFS general substrate transporter n=1 Tax=Testicularia cyperi TaxID=1882483 RepID=A0A317XGB0_9BASI|nr:MFS general substrate transporter [Testicularia cyperi]
MEKGDGVPTYYMVDSKGMPQHGQELVGKISTLGANAGTLQNLESNGEIILIPTPTNDPNDPLNWSRPFKWYLTCLVCFAAFMSNLTTAGPSIAILQTSATFGTLPPKTAYLYSCAALMQGASMFWWSPLVSKFGKRPIYVLTYLLYLATCLGAGACKTWSSQLGVRIILGAASGAGEMLGPLTISDMWYVHERTTPMAAYQAFLSVGVAFGMIIDGAIVTSYTWRHIYWVSSALIGALCVLVIFTFPETSFRRPALANVTISQQRHIDMSQKKTLVQNLKLFHGIRTNESFLKLFLRPWAALLLPAVAWAALTFSATIGFIVAVTSNVALAFGQTYGFNAQKVGLCFFAGLIGSVLGIWLGGVLPDFISHRAVVRNRGLREPEMKLPSIVPAIIAAPLSLVLYGAGIHFSWHWIVPTIGLGLLNFTVVAGTNVAMMYAVDCYKPITEEVVTAILGYKAFFGFLLSFYTNSWVTLEGYLKAYSEMAAISGAIILLALPMYIWGKRMRQASLNWTVFKVIQWNDDRDDLVLETE